MSFTSIIRFILFMILLLLRNCFYASCCHYSHYSKLHKNHPRLAFLSISNIWINNHRLLTTTPTSLNMNTISSNKREAPAAIRNRDPIWNVLSQYMLQYISSTPTVKPKILEIAAGCGTHTEYFCQKLIETNIMSSFDWYSSDPDPESLASIEAYTDELTELMSKIDLDKSRAMSAKPMKLTLNSDGIIEESTIHLFQDMTFDFMININMIHISPWEATLGLMKLAGEKLKANGGVLFLYGPFKVDGTCVESNQSFDQSLRYQNPSWGVRDLESVIEVANINGFDFIKTIEMPANNLSVIFVKR